MKNRNPTPPNPACPQSLRALTASEREMAEQEFRNGRPMPIFLLVQTPDTISTFRFTPRPSRSGWHGMFSAVTDVANLLAAAFAASGVARIYEVLRFPESADADGRGERIPRSRPRSMGVFLEAESREERTVAGFGVRFDRSGIFSGFHEFEAPPEELLKQPTLGVLGVKQPTRGPKPGCG